MASLIPCKICSKEVARSAKTCPHCGARLRMGFFKKAFLGIVGFIVIIIVIAAAASSGGGSTSTATTTASTGTAPTTSAAAPTPSKNEGTLSKAEFDQLKTGMTYDEATNIIGGPGEVLSESGTKGGNGLDIHTVMYQYKGEGSFGANANLMFQDEKLMNKAQMGLK